MKIAYIAPSTVPSQTANSVQVMKVCQALTQLNHTVQLFIGAGQPTQFEELRPVYGLETEFEIDWLKSRPALRKIDFAWQAVSKARANGTQLIYTRMIWAAIFSLLRHTPVILEMHELPGGHFSPWLYQQYLRLPGTKLTVFITRALQTLIETTLHVSHTDACIAPDGVDLERFAHLSDPVAARKQLGLKESLTAVYSGSFFAGRGIESLFELAVAFPQVQFVWIGAKPDQLKQWQQKLVASGVNNVVLYGFIQNQQLPLFQAAADILLLPYSRSVAGNSGGDIAHVTSPMKVFEYLASGRAILCSDLPVLHEVLNETNAVFYAPEEMEQMKTAFESLLNNTNLRIKISAQAKQDALQYSWKCRMQAILDQFLRLKTE